MRTLAPLLRVSGCALVLVAIARCGSSSPSNPNDAPTSAVIGTTGGTITSADGVFDVIVPPGAVSSDVTMTVTPTNVAPAGALGLAYGVEPLATVLQAPVTLVFHYASVNLDGTDPSTLFASTTNGTIWQNLPDPLWSAASKTISGTTLLFSVFGITGATVTTIAEDGGVETRDGSTVPIEDGSAALCTGTLTSSTAGSDCEISESCSDGHQYVMDCSVVSNTCTCKKDGVETATAGVACSSLNASSLQACDYPVGTIAPAATDEAGLSCLFQIVQPSDAGDDAGASCSVTENCGPAGVYVLLCNGSTGNCTCIQDGQLTGAASASCSTLGQSSITKCGFPGP